MVAMVAMTCRANSGVSWTRNRNRLFHVRRPICEPSLGVVGSLGPLSEGLLPPHERALEATQESDFAWGGGVHLPRLDGVQELLEGRRGLGDGRSGWTSGHGSIMRYQLPEAAEGVARIPIRMKRSSRVEIHR